MESEIKVVKAKYVSTLVGCYYASILTCGLIVFQALMYQEQFSRPDLPLTAIKTILWYIFIGTVIMLGMIALKLDTIMYALITSAIVIGGLLFAPMLYQTLGPYFFLLLIILLLFQLINAEINKAIPKLLMIGLSASVMALRFTPMTLFLVFTILMLFDIIAVYVTKHMVSIATSRFGDMLTLNVIIGSIGFADFMFPMAITLSFARTLHPMLLYGVAAMTAIGLMHLIVHIKPGKFYPALPPVYIMTMSGIYLAHVIALF